MGMFRRTRWEGCRGVQITLSKRVSLEFWYLPANTIVPPHTHGFDSKFVLLFGRGAMVSCAGRDCVWEKFRVYDVRKDAEHHLFAPNALVFGSLQIHPERVTSASEDFQRI